MSTAGQNFEKYSLYAKNRYPYNPNVHAAHSVRGNSATLGSGIRGPPSSSGNSSFMGRDTTFLTDYSDTRGMPSYVDRRIATIKSKTSLAFQIVAAIIGLVVFVSPGWGRTVEDATEDPEIRANLPAYYGLWMYCRKTSRTLSTKLQCTSLNLLQECEGSSWKDWYIPLQVLGTVLFFVSLLLILLIGIYICRKASNRKSSLALVILLFSIFTCLAIAASVIVFAVMFLDTSWWCKPTGEDIVDAELWFAWYLHIAQFVFQVISCIATLAEYISLKRL